MHARRMHRFALTSVFVASLVTTSAAFADVTPPDVSACAGKSVGAACTNGTSAGACASGKCTKIDYSKWDRDASPSPPTVEYDCVKCVGGASPDAGGQTSSGDDSGGCSLSARRLGSWALSAVPAIALALFERRRRRSAR